MNFEFTEEQTMLRDSITRFIKDEYNFDMRRKIVESETAMSAANWQMFANLGWLSIPFAEEYGGFGGDVVDLMLIMEEFGKGLVVEPYFATVVLFGGLLNKGGTAIQKETFIPKIIEGSCQGAFAYLERQSRYELTDVKTTAIKRDGKLSLNGEKVAVVNGANADQFIISVRSQGNQYDEKGISLYRVAADAEGLELKCYRMMDGQLVANLVLTDVIVDSADLVGLLNEAYPLMESLALEAKLALAGEALGIMNQLNAKTLEYTKTRKQFDVVIGSFQALQHRMVDTFMAYEQVKSLLYRALCSWQEGGEDSVETVHALAVLIDKVGKQIFGEAIQIHGGMGLTDELDIGHYAKRLMMINTSFGDGDYHQEKFCELRYQ